MEHIIFDNYDNFDTMENTKQQISEQRDIPVEDVTDQMVYDEWSESESMWFNDELENLDQELEGRIIAIADLGLWDGRKSGYKIGGTNLNEVMTIGNHDYVKVYSDGYNIRKESSHHDGTNRTLFRMVRENRDIERFTDMLYNGKPISKSVLNYYTKSIEKNVRSIFGW